jgi:integrase
MLAALGTEGLRAKRDHALLTLGAVGRLRCAALVSLDADDVEALDVGLRLRLAGRTLDVPASLWPAACSARAVQAWREAAQITSGALFRAVDKHGHVSVQRLSAAAVNDVVRRAARAAGLDPERFSGRSLRAGIAGLIEDQQ